jgi:hypothetical protein
MNKHYCIQCGAGTGYEFEKPKFCGSCGQPFAGTAVAKTAKVIPTGRAKPPSVVDLVDEEEPETLPEIDKENFFQISGLERNVFKAEDLVGSSQEKRDPRKASSTAKVNKKQVLKNFSERAASKTKTIEVK